MASTFDNGHQGPPPWKKIPWTKDVVFGLDNHGYSRHPKDKRKKDVVERVW